MDANQGVQAQTVSNFYQAFANNLEIIPVINKIDLPNADPEGVRLDHIFYKYVISYIFAFTDSKVFFSNATSFIF